MPDPFTPPSSTLPPLSDYDPLTDIDWDSVRSIADEQGWVWDEDQGVYLDGETPVDSDALLAVTYDEIEQIEKQLADTTSKLEKEEITLAEWERSLAEITVVAAALFFLFGIGARGSITDDHSQYLKTRLTIQYEYLRAFSERVAAGQLSIAAIVANANLYPQDAQLNFSEAQLFAHTEDTWPYYSNVLGGCMHCTQCPDETAQGIVERGTLTPIGGRLCRWRCCCMWAFYKTKTDGQSFMLPKSGWIGGAILAKPMTNRLSSLLVK